MIAIYVALAGATASVTPPSLAISCKLDLVSVGYYGSHGNLQPTSPKRRTLQTHYIVDFAQTSLTSKGRDYELVTINNPTNGSSVVVGPDGMDVNVTKQMIGGFVIKSFIHFDKSGLTGSMTKDLISRGAIIEHDEGTLICDRRSTK